MREGGDRGGELTRSFWCLRFFVACLGLGWRERALVRFVADTFVRFQLVLFASVVFAVSCWLPCCFRARTRTR